MSFQTCPDPVPGDPCSVDAVETTLVPRSRDIGGFEVRRALPAAERRMVGPFVFFDQMGPSRLEAGKGLDVRPHPHINLATITYLFQGEILHRDSLGTEIVIRPGAVNWMTAGRGIVHSERTPPEARVAGPELWGLQTWIALPREKEETAPAFAHHDEKALPCIVDGGVSVRLVVGSAWGSRSPVATFSDTVYADATLAAGAVLPIDPEHEERALYIVDGEIRIGEDAFEAGRMVVLRPGAGVAVRNAGSGKARVVLIGGATLDGPRHIWWNFVSSSRERIEQAKAEWKAGRFDTVPGDAEEFIPLPE
jgi:redox-sensitive bicupin YhaK (pirin superfamily)